MLAFVASTERLLRDESRSLTHLRQELKYIRTTFDNAIEALLRSIPESLEDHGTTVSRVLAVDRTGLKRHVGRLGARVFEAIYANTR